MQGPKVVLLLMQVRRDIVAQQGEEAGDSKGLVAVAQDLEVDGVQVEVE